MKVYCVVFACLISLMSYGQSECDLFQNPEVEMLNIADTPYSEYNLSGGWHWVKELNGFIALGESVHVLHLVAEEEAVSLSLERGALFLFEEGRLYIERNSSVPEEYEDVFIAETKTEVYRIGEGFGYGWYGDCWASEIETRDMVCLKSRDKCILQVSEGKNNYIHKGKCGSTDSRFFVYKDLLIVEGMPRSKCL